MGLLDTVLLEGNWRVVLVTDFLFALLCDLSKYSFFLKKIAQ